MLKMDTVKSPTVCGIHLQGWPTPQLQSTQAFCSAFHDLHENLCCKFCSHRMNTEKFYIFSKLNNLNNIIIVILLIIRILPIKKKVGRLDLHCQTCTKLSCYI